MGDNWLAVARIFQVGQFRDDEANQSLIVRRIDGSLGLYAFEVDPNAGRRSEHFAAVGFGPAPIDARKRRVSQFALLPDLGKEQGKPAFLARGKGAEKERKSEAQALVG